MPDRVTGVGKALRREAEARARALGERGRAEGLLTVGDLRRAARRAVPRAVFDFVDGAACDEVTARRNRADFERWALVPRALSGVEQPRLEATVLGHATSFPLLGAPTGLTGLVHHLGELGLARALHQAGGIYVLSSMASYTIEEVVAGSRGPIWLQVYPWRDRQLVRSLLERARDVGIKVLVVTVDVPHAGPASATPATASASHRAPPRGRSPGLSGARAGPRRSCPSRESPWRTRSHPGPGGPIR